MATSTALAIADEIKRRHPQCDILFVGAKGRMEMEKVPAAGYAIKGLWITGVDRNWRSLRNWLFPFKLISSLWNARRILRRFRPELVVGVGGFASGPVLHPSRADGHSHRHSRTKLIPRHHQPVAGERGVDLCRLPWAGTLVSSGPHRGDGNPLRMQVLDAISDHGQTPRPWKHFVLTEAVQWCLSWAVASVRLP